MSVKSAILGGIAALVFAGSTIAQTKETAFEPIQCNGEIYYSSTQLPSDPTRLSIIHVYLAPDKKSQSGLMTINSDGMCKVYVQEPIKNSYKR